MRHLQPLLSAQTQSPLSSFCSPFFLTNNCRRIPIHGFQFNCCKGFELKRKGFLNFNFNRKRFAVEERDQSEFEVDPDKAREALRKLDQQLQSLSDKRVKSPPKIRVAASEVNRRRRDVTAEEEAEFTGSILPYAAFFLFMFTIFYNVLFYTVIKPSIDGPEPELSPPSVTMSLREDASSPPEKIPPLLEYLHRFE